MEKKVKVEKNERQKDNSVEEEIERRRRSVDKKRVMKRKTK